MQLFCCCQDFTCIHECISCMNGSSFRVSFWLNTYSRKSDQYIQAYTTRQLCKTISVVMIWSLLLCNGKRTQNALPRHFPYFLDESLDWRFVGAFVKVTVKHMLLWWCPYFLLLSSPFVSEAHNGTPNKNYNPNRNPYRNPNANIFQLTHSVTHLVTQPSAHLSTHPVYSWS